MQLSRSSDWVYGTALISSSAFAGCNVFIGISMGTHWLRLDPAEYASGFWIQFQTFLLTVMPLFILVLFGLAWSARISLQGSNARRLWLLAIACYAAVSLITITLHLPINLRFQNPQFTIEETITARNLWLIGHIPRVLLACAIPALVWTAITREVAQVSRRVSNTEPPHVRRRDRQ